MSKVLQQALARLKETSVDSTLTKLERDLCDAADDQICDVAPGGKEIEVYLGLSDTKAILKKLGFKGSKDSYTKGNVKVKLRVPKGERKTVYLSLA